MKARPKRKAKPLNRRSPFDAELLSVNDQSYTRRHSRVQTEYYTGEVYFPGGETVTIGIYGEHAAAIKLLGYRLDSITADDPIRVRLNENRTRIEQVMQPGVGWISVSEIQATARRKTYGI